jgi:hypothetical protein
LSRKKTHRFSQFNSLASDEDASKGETKHLASPLIRSCASHTPGHSAGSLSDRSAPGCPRRPRSTPEPNLLDVQTVPQS